MAGLQWNLTEIDAPSAWRRGIGRGITVAVVDSGVDSSHPDLRAKVVGEVSCVGSAGDPARCRGNAFDGNGHGTHVAGIIAASTDNAIGIAGVAPGADILAIRVLTDRCGFNTCSAEGAGSDVAAGIRWAVSHGADVINLSLGSASPATLGPDYRAALRSAWHHGVIPVVAAGNGTGTGDLVGEPALVVTALDRAGRRADYASGVGAVRWGLAAPGGDPGDTPSTCGTGGSPLGVFSTYPRSVTHPNGYACLAGTSAAAPQVAGAAVILRGLGLSPTATVHRLLATATDLGPRGRDTTYGSGALDVARAARIVVGRGQRSVPPRLHRSSTRTRAAGDGAVLVLQRRTRRLPTVLVMAMGGLSAGAVTDLVYRRRQRRRAR